MPTHKEVHTKIMESHHTLVESAWLSAGAVTKVRDILKPLGREQRLNVLMILVAEAAPNEAPTNVKKAIKDDGASYAPGPPVSQRRRISMAPSDYEALKERVLSAVTVKSGGIARVDIIAKSKSLGHRIDPILLDLEKDGKVERINRSRWRQVVRSEKTKKKKLKTGTKDDKERGGACKAKRLLRLVDPPLVTGVGHGESAKLSAQRREVIFGALNGEPMSREEISTKLGWKHDQNTGVVGTALRELKNERRVKRHGFGKHTKWSRLDV